MASPPCPELVGPGAIQYRCRLDMGHEGPCLAPESGPSQIKRGQWEADQKKAAAIPVTSTVVETPPEPEPEVVMPSTAHEGVVEVDTPREDTSIFAIDGEMALGYAVAYFAVPEYDNLPSSLRSWALGVASQLILNQLREAVKDGGTLVLDRDTVESLIPPPLRT